MRAQSARMDYFFAHHTTHRKIKNPYYYKYSTDFFIGFLRLINKKYYSSLSSITFMGVKILLDSL